MLVGIKEEYEQTQEEAELKHCILNYQLHSYSEYFFSYAISFLQGLIVAFNVLRDSVKFAKVVAERDAALEKLNELEEVEVERDAALARLEKSKEVCTGLKTVGGMMQSTLHSARVELESWRKVACDAASCSDDRNCLA